MTRTSSISRSTNETSVTVGLDLDGSGRAEVRTGLGFFDHMLAILAGHSLVDLAVHCEGDLHVDGHHTVEDVGRTIGQGVREALGDRRGIRRYGAATVPMDDALFAFPQAAK